jgi:hypothetical protein
MNGNGVGEEAAAGSAPEAPKADVVAAPDLPEKKKRQPRGPEPAPEGGPKALLALQLQDLRNRLEPLRSQIPNTLSPWDRVGVLKERIGYVRSASVIEGMTVATATQLARDKHITDEEYDEHIARVRALVTGSRLGA